MHRFALSAVLVVSVAGLLGSWLWPWLLVPGAASGAPPVIGGEYPDCQVLFQVVCGCYGLAAIASSFWRPWDRVAVVRASLGLCSVLFFPYCQMASQPSLTARAAWLHVQHENLTWLGGDIFRNQELEQSPSQMDLYLSDTPRQVAVLDLPSWSPLDAGLHSLPGLVEWLGFTNTFCQFVRRGWWLALLGMSCLLLYTLFENGRASMLRMRWAVRTMLWAGCLGALVAWIPPLRASAMLSRAAASTQRGDHVHARRWLAAAGQTWNPLREDTWYIVQRGLTEFRLETGSPYANYHAARAREEVRQFDLAVDAYRNLAQDRTVPSPIRREACRGVLRHAVRAVNAGNWEQAVRDLRLVLEVEPYNIKALYALHLCYIHVGNGAALRDASLQLASVYSYLNYPDKQIVLGKSNELATKARLLAQQPRGGWESP